MARITVSKALKFLVHAIAFKLGPQQNEELLVTKERVNNKKKIGTSTRADPKTSYK